MLSLWFHLEKLRDRGCLFPVETQNAMGPRNLTALNHSILSCKQSGM